MRFDYIDIGTSDFDTRVSILQPDQTILLVEPVLEYLSRLPSGSGIYTCNVAISDKDRYGIMYYIPRDTVLKFNLPEWVCGCHSLDVLHPTISNIIKTGKLPAWIVEKWFVQVLSFDSLLLLFGVTEIGSLKIDTEGHDHIILTGVLAKLGIGFPLQEIIFEYHPVFGNTDILDKQILDLTENFGFQRVICNNSDDRVFRRG